MRFNLGHSGLALDDLQNLYRLALGHAALDFFFPLYAHGVPCPVTIASEQTFTESLQFRFCRARRAVIGREAMAARHGWLGTLTVAVPQRKIARR